MELYITTLHVISLDRAIIIKIQLLATKAVSLVSKSHFILKNTRVQHE